MFDIINVISDKIINGGFRIHVTVFFTSLAMGIIIIQQVFNRLLKIIAKKTNVSYSILQQTFRGIPTLLGILIGFYAVMEILAIPPRPLLFLQKLFRSLVILSLTLLIARLSSGYLKQKFGKTSGAFASTSILATTIDLAVYTIGILFLLESFGVAISPLLTALASAVWLLPWHCRTRSRICFPVSTFWWPSKLRSVISLSCQPAKRAMWWI